MTWVWIDRWSEIGRDTLLYYTFTQKSGWDLLEFWLLFLVMAFFHETAHGLTCKHYGARVPNMGFQLIYLAPAFATEITEIWVRAGRRERLLAILAGIWMEGFLCAIATVVWVFTPRGAFAHEWAYKVMLITGIITVIVNLNPLIKLDGYYMLGEMVGISELKERATGFVAGWVKKHLFRLPVEVEYVPFRRRFLYVPYALLSGVYSYLLLFAISRFTYNVLSNWFGEWAIIPAALVAWKIFMSRIFRLGAFMKTVFQDKREHIVRALTPARVAAGLVALAVLVLAPIFPRNAKAMFVLEPVSKAVMRAKVPGFVEKVYVREGAAVKAGSPLVTLRNADLEGEAAKAEQEAAVARANRTHAQVVYASLGSAESEVQRTDRIRITVGEQLRELEPRSPIAGVVVTPRVGDLEGRYVAEGTLLMEIEDPDLLKARVYLPEFEVKDVRVGQQVTLHPRSRWGSITGKLDTLAVSPSKPEEGLFPGTKYKGLQPPSFYAADVLVSGQGRLRPGMSGEARIFICRESLARKIWDGTREVISRKLW
jgi:putative peptide zinc metalloprotease protein